MTEVIPSQWSQVESEKQTRLEKYISLAEKLSQITESLPFSGLNEESLAKLIAVDEEYPGVTTDTKTIVARMEKEGIKVVLGKDPKSGNAYILPFMSDNIEMDSLFPRHLKAKGNINIDLNELIALNQEG